MAIKGELSAFSLPELFQFLEQGKKTGRLLVQRPVTAAGGHGHANGQPRKEHYIWLRQGRIVAAANRLDNLDLLRLIYRRGWLKKLNLNEVRQLMKSPMITPMGVYLRMRGWVEADHLKMLFYTQIMRQVCTLFEYTEGSFEFESKAVLPMAEMTGHMMLPTEVTLGSLRVLRDWSALEDKLPEATSTLTSVIEGKPHLRLNRLEWQVWEFTNGTMSLQEIAEQLRLSLDVIRQVAFRLIVVGLAEESLVMMGGTALGRGAGNEESEAEELSPSFLQSLVTFLKGQA